MANRLKMATVQAIIALHRQGWSNRRIARELGVHRDTVGRYVELEGLDEAKRVRVFAARSRRQSLVGLTRGSGLGIYALAGFG